MELQQIIELIGYLGTILVIVSMLMTSVIKLRVINTVGSVIFGAYALCIHSYPTAAMQVFLIVINVVNICKLLGTKKEYSVVKVAAGDLYLEHFLQDNHDEIKKFFPDFEAVLPDDVIYLVCCKETCAGVLIAAPQSDNSLNVRLDYTTPAYRDTSVGRFLYSQLAASGIQNLKAQTTCPAHEKYLRKMGFEKLEGCFRKML